MKKRVLALILSLSMTCGFMLTACGGSDAAPAAENTEVAEEAPADTAEDAAATEDTAAADTAAEAAADDASATSGNDFAQIQENYASLSEAYDAVVDAYNDNSIKQSDEVESDLAQAKELMDELGNLSEDDFKTPEDYTTMNQAILDMCTVLNGILDKMEAAE